MVKVDFAFICKNLTHHEGNINAEAIGLQGLSSRGVPTQHPGLWAIISMKFTAAEVRPMRIGIHVLDLDGNEAGPSGERPFDPPPPLPGSFYRYQRIEVNMGNTIFPRFGEYNVVWRLDGVDLHSMLLRVIPTTSP